MNSLQSINMNISSQFERARTELEKQVRHGSLKRDMIAYLVDDLLQFDLPVAARYSHLDVIRILQDNCVRGGPGMAPLMRGLSILERYGKNLLRSERPSQWRVVRLSNSIFKQEVDIIKGARNILKLLGYTRLVPDGLSYPDEIIIPDVPTIASVTADILLLRHELLMLANREHKMEKDFYPYIPAEEIKKTQLIYLEKARSRAPPPPSSSAQPSLINDNQKLPGVFPNPPTYEAVLQGAGRKLDEPMLIETPSPQPLNQVGSSLNNVSTSSFENFSLPVQPIPEQADVEILDEELCDICGQKKSTLKCHKCDKIFCVGCDKIWHNNPKRRNHTRDLLENGQSGNVDVPESGLSNSSISNGFGNRLSNGSVTSATYPSQQEQGGPGNHSLQPTLSGERLRPTLHSRTSTLSEDNEWTRKVNRMAAELMDIEDHVAKTDRLMQCLADLDKEAKKYQIGIAQLTSKADKKPSLANHFQEKVDKIEDIKKQFKTLCGYEDPPDSHVQEASMEPPLPSVEFSQFSNIPSEGGWSFKSSRSENESNTNEENAIASQRPATSHSSERSGSSVPKISMPSVPVANLIDLATPEAFGPNSLGQSVISYPSTSNEPVNLPYTTPQIHNNNDEDRAISPVDEVTEIKSPGGGWGDAHETSQPKNISAVEDPDLQSEGDDYRSAEEGEMLPVVNIVGSRLEEPILSTTSMFLPNLSKEDLQSRIKKEENLFQTMQFVDLIRAGSVASFRPEQVEVALKELEKEGNQMRYTPNSWLERNWSNHVKSFIVFMKEKGFKISIENAEDVLLEAEYNFEKAFKLIEEDQNEQVRDLGEVYGYDAARKAMSLSKGDKYSAGATLQKPSLQDIFKEFDEKEADNEDDIVTFKRAVEIEDQQLKIHSMAILLNFKKTSQGEMLNALIDNLPDEMLETLLPDAVEAISSDDGTGYIDVEAALRYLDNECMICTEKFPQSKITCLPTCGDNGCKYCRSCLEQHLAVCVTDKNIRDIVCPVCSKPETNSDEESLLNFFSHIDAILRHMPDKKIHNIFLQKSRDFTLMRLPNFRWCSHCSGGFQYEYDAANNNLKMVCPFCRKGTCYKCKKHWEAQHDGITCEQFQRWKESNDPEFQAVGLARHLKENGIDCPDCNFRYALAKGGCMHFKCIQCSHEFCSGCASPFKHGRKCGKLISCQNKGLHAHHPRDCLFYLRDYNIALLQKLLRDNNVQYNTKGSNQKTCEVMEQKETPNGMKDDACGRAVVNNCAGLCKLHYVEYLVNLVNMNGLDPADIFSIEELKTCLRREDIDIPQKKPREPEDSYRKTLLAEVKKLPLKRQGQNQAGDNMEH